MAVHITLSEWIAVFLRASVPLLLAISFHVFSRRPATKKALTLSLRIDEIPADTLHERLQSDLRLIVEQDPGLKEGLVDIKHHFIARRDDKTACATATFYTSIPANELLRKLGQAKPHRPYRFDADFHGVTPLFEPIEGTEVDVIAVSGLGSHAIGSWRSPSNKDVWLRDYLPEDVPNIRILLFGYDTSLLCSYSKDSIEDLGRRFLESIKAFRKGAAERRPIVFIGHSLGGLLIKEACLSCALVHARKKSDDSQNVNFYRACYGLLLFGVPNLGLRHEQLLSIVEDQPNKTLIRDLVVDDDSEPSPFLRRISDQFSECCKGQYKVVSFFERKMTRTVQVQPNGTLARTGPPALMVTEKSATSTGLTAAADENNFSFNRDHSGLVKFESRSQMNYTIVKEKLRMLVDEAGAEVCQRFPDNRLDARKSALISDCLKSLAFPHMHTRSHDIDRAFQGTCRWLFRHQTYTNWAASDRGLLWIKGKPGSGKSTLLKYALANRETGGSDLVLSFFCHGRGDELQKTLLGLFRSLLHQLLTQVPDALLDLIDTFGKRRGEIGESGEKWQWHQGELLRFFELSLPKILETFSVWLFIDALDECGKENAVTLVENFKSLRNSLPPASIDHKQLHICFTCRPYPILDLDHGFEICAESENGKDISAFVDARLCSHYMQSSAIPTLITERANGVFLWAVLVVKQVLNLDRDGNGLNKIEAAIYSIPQELHTLYENLMQSVSLKLIQWICFATRPLSINELRWAMVIEADCPYKSLQECESAEDYVFDNDRMMRQVQTLSCGLAEVTHGQVVQFIHQSVKDFFIEKGVLALNPSLITINAAIGMAHFRLSRICIRYLAMDDISQSTSENMASDFPFLSYATQSWVAHTERADARNICQEDLLELFDWPLNSLMDLWVRVYNEVDKHSYDCPPNGTTLLHTVARYNVSGILSIILPKVDLLAVHIDAKDRSGWTPLSWAAGAGHEAVVRQLLDAGADVNVKDNGGRTSLSWATKRGHEVVVRQLLNAGADVNAKDGEGWTPLLLAADEGYEAIIRQLLNASADVNAKDNKGWTPLSWAAERGYEAIVRQLLNAGAHVNATDNKRQTPLLWATGRGHEAIVRQLLDAGANVNAKDNRGQMSLSWAVRLGYKPIIRQLLNAGADINAKDDEGWTSLIWAARRGHKRIVRQLLGEGADINAKDNGGRTSLSWAAGLVHGPLYGSYLTQAPMLTLEMTGAGRRYRGPLDKGIRLLCSSYLI